MPTFFLSSQQRTHSSVVSKGAKIRYRYNQVPHLTQDTNGKVTNSQLDTTNESQEVTPFPAGDHKAHINRRVQRHSKHKTEIKIHKRSTALERSVKYFTGGLKRVKPLSDSNYVKLSFVYKNNEGRLLHYFANIWCLLYNPYKHRNILEHDQTAPYSLIL